MERTKKALPAMATAYLLWFVTFYIRPFNFWFDISLSSLILMLLSASVSRPLPLNLRIPVKQIILSMLSAFLLYIVFFYGNQLTYLLPNAEQNVQSVYSLAKGTNPALLAILLTFPIASGEEIFWRGFIQRVFSERYSNRLGYAVSVLGDTTVHLSSLNPVLIVAALITSIAWAYIFLYTKNLAASLTSHILWDLLVFVLLPVK